MKAKPQNLNFLQFQWDFLAAVALALSWLGVYFPLRMHAAAEKSDPFSLDIRDGNQVLSIFCLQTKRRKGKVQNLIMTFFKKTSPS